MVRNTASIFSIAMAEQIAIGHFNTGLNRYQLVQELVQHGEFVDEAEKAMKFAEATFPAVTNLALAVEIILKQHHFQISGVYPRGHDIATLCQNLPDESLEVMRTEYDSMQNDPKEHKGLSFRFEAGPTDRAKSDWDEISTHTFDEAIEYIGKTYVRWRYIYEEFETEVSAQISFAPFVFVFRAVKTAIQSFKGNTKMAINPMSE